MSDPTLAEQLAELDESDVTAIGEYVTDLASELDAERAKAADAVEALAKAQADEDGEDDVLKGVSPEVRERIEKAEADALAATERVAAVEKAERQRVFKARAESLVNLSGGDDGAASLGSVMEKAEAALDEDTYAELERVLTAADTQLTQGADDLFKASGQDGDPNGESVVERVTARAAELEAAGDSPLDAIKKARRENADDVNAHQSAVAKGERA